MTSSSTPSESSEASRPVRAWMKARPADVVDVFVYVVVLNLAVQYLPKVLSESFSLSLVTAFLLKLILEVVLVVKGIVLGRLRAATTSRTKALLAMVLWAVAAGSKFVVLWIMDLVFGDAVKLGGFFSVTLLVVTLLVARKAVRQLLWIPEAQEARSLQ